MGAERVTRTANSLFAVGATTITRTLWSGADEIAELAPDGAGWRVLRRVLTGPGIDDRVAVIEHGTYDIPKYFHTDRLGSVVR